MSIKHILYCFKTTYKIDNNLIPELYKEITPDDYAVYKFGKTVDQDRRFIEHDKYYDKNFPIHISNVYNCDEIEKKVLNELKKDKNINQIKNLIDKNTGKKSNHKGSPHEYFQGSYSDIKNILDKFATYEYENTITCKMTVDLICTFCNKQFKAQNGLTKHMRYKCKKNPNKIETKTNTKKNKINEYDEYDEYDESSEDYSLSPIDPDIYKQKLRNHSSVLNENIKSSSSQYKKNKSETSSSIINKNNKQSYTSIIKKDKPNEEKPNKKVINKLTPKLNLNYQIRAKKQPIYLEKNKSVNNENNRVSISRISIRNKDESLSPLLRKMKNMKLVDYSLINLKNKRKTNKSKSKESLSKDRKTKKQRK